MSSRASPLDPLFYLHHCNIDRIWAIWQLNHASEVQYTNVANNGDSVDAVDSRTAIDELMVSFNETTATTPRMVLDHTLMGYDYPSDMELEVYYGKPLITGSVETLVVEGISHSEIDVEDGRFCTFDVADIIDVIGPREWMHKVEDDSNPRITEKSGIKGNQGTVLRIRNERTKREGGLLLWSSGSKAFACWNPTEYTKSDDWSIGDVITLLDFPRTHTSIGAVRTKQLASVAKYSKVSDTGWNLNADCIKFGECGLVGGWWKELEIEYELRGDSRTITGIWTDSVKLPYTIKYYQEDGDKWVVFRESCKGNVFDRELSKVNTKKWRLHWASTDLFQTQGLSTYRSGGGIHAELLS